MTETGGRRVLDEVTSDETLEHIHELLADLLRACPIDDMDAMQFELALAEIGANIIEHARDGSRVSLRLELEVAADRIEGRYSDDGHPARVDLDAVSLPDDVAERGRGLAIAIQILDELSYRRADGHNHWRLVRNRTA
ncbi:ATP-binding protein [Gordonia amicalis]|uniref:ATP-binding protein n=1 Tax=Gordonia amicalis TaxID=89053 RepID=UPI0002A651E9|nr:ATP-binding protein [Gordonia amicalis]MBA5849637.1 ATP-binding protein [Gordonia amicalis]MDV7098890.1 ATP-binding protein [Gordonia amicalis]MDV7173794.1 ATP-binding protein [Gordonia amicalis]NKX76831.1 ATP-binding protein [Gordonia amicalis]UKO90884.1 ATP-binding protein [Gordonia amicalis]